MRRISTTYSIVTPESAQQGDFAESGWEDEDGREFEDVDEAIAWLHREGAAEPSSSSFHAGIWYSGYPIPDYRTGADKTYAYHLKGFTDAEQRQVFNAITRRSNPGDADQTAAEAKLAKMLAFIESGGTVYLQTALRAWKIDKKTVKRFADIGKPVLKAKNGGLWMLSGKSYVCIDGCRITGQNPPRRRAGRK